MIFKKLLWTLKRHPFLYTSRFKLLSKNSNIHEIQSFTYNQVNNSSEIPSYFFEINELIFSDGFPISDLDKVKKINLWLCNNIKGGRGLSVPSEEALKIMLDGKGGVCSDMAQIFNNFCVINDVQVREWGSTRAPFDKDYGGHSYNEVFIDELNKWVLIDVSYGILFCYNNSLLSVIDFFELSRNGKKVTYNSFTQPSNDFNSSVNKNYFNLNTVPFLICNYSNKTYDSYLSYYRPYFPVFFIHFILFVLKKSYHYRFPLNNYKDIFNKKLIEI